MGDNASNAAPAVVCPVPPEAIAKVADNPAAVPLVFWLSVGTSATCMVFITTFAPLPRKYDPLVTAPAKAFIAV